MAGSVAARHSSAQIHMRGLLHALVLPKARFLSESRCGKRDSKRAEASLDFGQPVHHQARWLQWHVVLHECAWCLFIVKSRFREWFEDPCSGIFFVMELCTGPSLQNILEDRTMLPRRTTASEITTVSHDSFVQCLPPVEDVCALCEHSERTAYLQKLRRFPGWYWRRWFKGWG